MKLPLLLQSLHCALSERMAVAISWKLGVTALSLRSESTLLSLVCSFTLSEPEYENPLREVVTRFAVAD